MATCSQVDSFFQAHLDGELDPSEAVILEEHLRGCGRCRAEVSSLNTLHHEFVGACRMHRLRGTLEADVLAHLPDMDPALEHGSHPTDPGVKAVRFSYRLPVSLVALAAMLLIGVMGVALLPKTEPAIADDAIGMVVYMSGAGAVQKDPETSRITPIELTSLVKRRDDVETLGDTKIAIALAQGSTIKIAPHSLVTIEDSRTVYVERGMAYFDVERGQRHFYVTTPTGEILVYGTSFVVSVTPDSTTVAVYEGNILASTPEGMTAVTHGKHSILRRGQLPTPPEDTTDESLISWCASMIPDKEALALFYQTIGVQSLSTIAVPAEAVYAVRNLRGREVVGIQIDWNFDGSPDSHCGYFLQVTDSTDNLLFLDTIHGNIFDQSEVEELILTPKDGPISGVDVIHVRLIPDFDTGSIESTIRVKAVVR